MKRNTRAKERNVSITRKILTIPLVIIFTCIFLITSVTSYILRKNMHDQMKVDGLNLAKEVGSKIKYNSSAIEMINKTMDSKLMVALKAVSNGSGTFSDELLKDISKKLEVHEVNITDKDGNILFSNFKENVGLSFDETHVARAILRGEATELTEETRKSTSDGLYYKYGYVALPNGGFVQVGLLADEVEKFNSSIEMQAIINELSKEDGIDNAFIIDKDMKISAHSNPSEIGKVIENEEIKKAVMGGNDYSEITFIPEKKIDVYNIIVPLTNGNDLIGALNIGLSMEKLNTSVLKIIGLSVIISLATFIIAGGILFVLASSITKPIKELVKVSADIAEGNLTGEVKVRTNDEIGLLADGFRKMSHNLNESIGIINEQAATVSEMSNSLTSNSKGMTDTADTVASSINEVARGSSEQTNHMINISQLGDVLTEDLNNINHKVTLVKENSSITEEKAFAGKNHMDELFSSIDRIKKSFEEVSQKVSNLNSSVSKVNNITNVIDGISEQTNLLALNAAIEAARAGESGRGFAVVADEVRKLAEQSKQSTEEIHKLISNISLETSEVINTSNNVKGLVEDQVGTAKSTIDAFSDILNAISTIPPLVEDTYVSLKSTIEAKDEVISKISDVTTISEEAAASSEEIAASSEELLSSAEEISSFASELNLVAEKLKQSSDKFTVKDN